MLSASLRSIYVAVLVFIYGCSSHVDSFCEQTPACQKTQYAYVIGSNAQSVGETERELSRSALRYWDWTATPPPYGIVSLDSTVSLPEIDHSAIHWRLTYDVTRAQVLEGVIGLTPESKGPTTDRRAVSDSVDFLTRSGALSHEICHRYALFVFNSAHRQARLLPDALGETAAISCETNESREERLLAFKADYKARDIIPWEKFMVMSHPLNTDPSQLVAHGMRSGSGIVYFDLSQQSAIGKKVAVYYEQAAALSEFLREESCSRNGALGALLSSFDPTEGLDHWLRRAGKPACLPESLNGFNQAFARFMTS